MDEAREEHEEHQEVRSDFEDPISDQNLEDNIQSADQNAKEILHSDPLSAGNDGQQPLMGSIPSAPISSHDHDQRVSQESSGDKAGVSGQVSTYSQPPALISSHDHDHDHDQSITQESSGDEAGVSSQVSIHSQPPALISSHDHDQGVSQESSGDEGSASSQVPAHPDAPEMPANLVVNPWWLFTPTDDPPCQEAQFQHEYASQSRAQTYHSIVDCVGTYFQSPYEETQPYQNVYFVPTRLDSLASVLANGINIPQGLQQPEQFAIYRYEYTVHVYRPCVQPVSDDDEETSHANQLKELEEQSQQGILTDLFGHLSTEGVQEAAADDSSSDGDGANGAANVVQENGFH